MPQKVEEGFRVLTLETEVNEEVLEFIKRYQILASHLYWVKRLGIKPSEDTIQKINVGIKVIGDGTLLMKGIRCICLKVLKILLDLILLF